MALKPIGSKGLLTINGIDLVKFVPELEAIQIATDNAIGNGDSTTASNAAADATTKANTAKTDAIADATTKYGGLPGRMTTIETGESAQTSDIADHETRIGNVEAIAGLAPGDVSDATVSTLLNDPATDSSETLSRSYGRDDVDYVDQLARNSPYNRLSLKRVATNDALEVTCYSPDGQHITHYIEGDASASGRDDYRIVGDIWSGKVGTTSKQYPDLTLTGTYTATVDQYGYTTQVGATWTTTVVVPFGGAQVRVYPYRDNRGGVWRYTLGGYQVDHSTYAATGGQDTNGALVSAGTITSGVYTLKAEFLGADPLNPPAGGVPARGWLARTPTGTFPADNYNLVKLPDNLGWPKTTVLGRESNREFAWWIKPQGSTAASEWVPHHGISSAFNAEPPVLYDGNRALDPVRLAIGESRPLVGPFKLVQHIYGRHSATGATNLLEVWTTHTIHADGRLTVEGKIKVLSPIELVNTFVIMAPVNSQIFDLAVTSLNNQYPNTAAQLGTNTFLPESDVAKSYLFLSSTNPTLGAAFRYNNPADTVRRGEADKNPTGGRAWLEHRTGGLILKHYQKLWSSGAVLPAGTVHRFSGDYIHLSAPQLYQQFSL